MAGIERYAVHLPRLTLASSEYQRQWGRVAGRFEQKRVPDHDEDAVTLALAAARKLLALGGAAPAYVAFASQEAPSLAPLVLDALGLTAARSAEFRGPTAGLDALLAANDATLHGAAMVVTADAPSFAADDDREHTAGAAATAWLLGPKGGAQLRRSAHGHAQELPGAPRGDVALARAFADLTRSGLAADSVARVAGPDLDARFASAAAKAFPKAKLTPAGTKVGEAGATSALLGLAKALEEAPPGEVVVLGAVGDGSAAAVSVEAERAPTAATLAQALAAPSEALDYARHARLRGWLSSPRSDVSQGAAVSPAQYLDQQPARLRWEGQRCQGCNHLQFPPRETCLKCGHHGFLPQRLHGRGEVYTLSTLGRGSAPAEFAEQQRRAGAYDVAIVQLEEGPRVAAQVCDAAPGTLGVGSKVELVVRRLYVQDGAVRYGFKARPT